MIQKSSPSTQLILASNSPRRQALFKLLDLPFKTVTAEVDETPVRGESPVSMVRRLSLSKARATADGLRTPSLILGLDTTVELDGDVLGKPSGVDEARRMLNALRDRPHRVHTGVSLVDTGRGITFTWSVASAVWMRPYGEPEVGRYIASGDPFDKAGSYSIQHAVFRPVARIAGCYANIMGMPLCHLARHLICWGLRPNASIPADCTAFTNYRCDGDIERLEEIERW